MYNTCVACKGIGQVAITIETQNDTPIDSPDCDGYGKTIDENYAYDEWRDNHLGEI